MEPGFYSRLAHATTGELAMQAESMPRSSSRSTRSSSLVSTSSQRSVLTPDLDGGAFPTAALAEEDDDVRMAIAALGIMKNSSVATLPAPLASAQLDPSRSTSTLSTTSGWSRSGTHPSTGASSPTGPPSLPPLSDFGDIETEDPKFMSRVSQLPLVSGGLEWYERSKASSRVVKYGAGLVESSLSSISRPLANNLQLGQLDEFACRQLDRLGGTSPGELAPKSVSPNFRHNILDKHDSPTHASHDHDFSTGEQTAVTEGNSSEVVQAQQAQQAVAVVSRSRWQTVLLEAGGLGAAVSEESLKSLRYCLQWLLYATAHLDHQITILRDFIASLHRHHPADSRSNALITASASAHLTQIKHDVVDTIRKVVDVVSKYAGAALPDQAKKYVRQSILGLPVKWASAIEGGRGPRGRSASVASTVDGMESGSERMNQGNEQASTSATNPALGPTEDAAERVLTFAVESLEMLKGVTTIFGESVEKAEAWIERLRIVGLDRQRERRAAAAGMSPPSPPDSLSSSAAGTKRRRGVIPVDIGSSVPYSRGTMEEDGLVRRKKSGRSSGRDSMEIETEG